MSSPKMPQIGGGGISVFPASSKIFVQMGTCHFEKLRHLDPCHMSTSADQPMLSRYAIVIITNQGSISLRNDPKTIKSDQRSLANFKTKVTSVFSHFDFPILLLAATARDYYRKPRIGMWKELLEDLDLDEGIGPDLQSSFFVGDASGRAARTNAKADHACSDR